MFANRVDGLPRDRATDFGPYRIIVQGKQNVEHPRSDRFAICRGVKEATVQPFRNRLPHFRRTRQKDGLRVKQFFPPRLIVGDVIGKGSIVGRRQVVRVFVQMFEP